MAFTDDIPKAQILGLTLFNFSINYLVDGTESTLIKSDDANKLSSEVGMSEGRGILQRDPDSQKRWVNKNSVKFNEVSSPAPGRSSQRQVQDRICVAVEHPYRKGPGSPDRQQADHESAVRICRKYKRTNLGLGLHP